MPIGERDQAATASASATNDTIYFIIQKEMLALPLPLPTGAHQTLQNPRFVVDIG